MPCGAGNGVNGVGVLRLRSAIREANRAAALRMTKGVEGRGGVPSSQFPKVSLRLSAKASPHRGTGKTGDPGENAFRCREWREWE